MIYKGFLKQIKLCKILYRIIAESYYIPIKQNPLHSYTDNNIFSNQIHKIICRIIRSIIILCSSSPAKWNIILKFLLSTHTQKTIFASFHNDQHLFRFMQNMQLALYLFKYSFYHNHFIIIALTNAPSPWKTPKGFNIDRSWNITTPIF